MKSVLLIVPALCLAAVAPAQTTPTPPTGGSGLGQLLGGGLPNLGGVGAGNAAGMLSYCVRNQLLGGTQAAGTGGAAGLLGTLGGRRAPAATPSPAPIPTTASATTAQTVLDRLLGRRAVTTSPGFAAGQAGQLQLGGGQALPVAGLGDQVKSRLCSAVLTRARAFL